MNDFWDRDKNGRFDIVDVFWILLQVMAYGVGAVLMLSTFGRSFHLLSSPQINPGVFSYWPWITAAAPEAGLIIAWLAGEVGFRKGRMELVALAGVGFVLFATVIATMSIYDSALVEGQDITATRPWAHMIASVLALITIAYSGLATMLLSYMSRREKLNAQSIGRQQSQWRETPRPQRQSETPRLPVVDDSGDFGERITDPLSQTRGQRAQSIKTARKTELMNAVRSMGTEDFPPPVSRNGNGVE